MSITYPISFPPSIGVRRLTWSPESTVKRSKSVYNYHSKVTDFGGKLRSAVIELPHLTVADAKLIQSFFMKLNGVEGTFYFGDSLGKAPQGSVADSYSGGLVNGASQTGTDLATDGWAINVTDLFKEGDWISINDRLYNVLENASSNGLGEATLTLWPDVSSPADNAVISVGTAARGVFALRGWPEWIWDTTFLQSGITFSIEEAI